MAGHSRWAQVKHKKAGADAKRGALFSKLARVISVAARAGGPDPDTNAKLRGAVEAARSAGVPKDNIARAIARAAGGGAGAALVEREYEAYGPGGAALLIETVTDNPNRTSNELKQLVAEFGGKFAQAGSVAWLFERRAEVAIEPGGQDAEEMDLTLIDAGAEDIRRTDAGTRALVRSDELGAFGRHVAGRGLRTGATRTVMVAKTPLAVDPERTAELRSLIAAVEDHPDVTAVWTNAGGR